VADGGVEQVYFIFYSNSAGDGGGLYIRDSDAIIQNNTFSNNSADNDGGIGIWLEDSSPTIRSNILVSNTASNAGGGIYNKFMGGSLTIDYNDVWNNADGDYSGDTPGVHDISADPLLVDPTHGDFHLAPGSPCIDAGDPFLYPSTDFEGDPRPMGRAPDIGADEFIDTILYIRRLYLPVTTKP